MCYTHRADHDLDQIGRIDHLDPMLVVMRCGARAVSCRPHSANVCARALLHRSHQSNTI